MAIQQKTYVFFYRAHKTCGNLAAICPLFPNQFPLIYAVCLHHLKHEHSNQNGKTDFLKIILFKSSQLLKAIIDENLRHARSNFYDFVNLFCCRQISKYLRGKLMADESL